MAKKKVYYKGKSSTQHRLAVLHPGVNELETSIADKLIDIGLVTVSPESKMGTNKYENKQMSSGDNKHTKKNDGGGKN